MKITDINNYVDKVQEQFPEISKQDIKRILTYGWKMILLYKSSGNDIHITDRNLFFFVGSIPNNPLKAYETYRYKLANRIRYMFKRTKSKWDGYYYFALTDDLYKDYLLLNRRKYKIFKRVFLFKLLDECKVKLSGKYIFRLKEDKTRWFAKFYEELKTKNAELIITRDTLKMTDVMTSCNKYKYINNGTNN